MRVAVARPMRNLDGVRQTVFASLLNIHVDGETDIGTRARGYLPHLSGNVARGIDRHRLLTANALEQALVAALDAGLAHHVAGSVFDAALGLLGLLLLLELL